MTQIQEYSQTEQALAELRQRYEGAGETYQQIADALNFSIASIWKWCKRLDGEKS